MTKFNWVERELSKHIPYLDLTEGADLDDNGRIEGSERIDQDGDQTIDTAEWQKFLGDNRAALTNMGGHFKHYYSTGTAFKPDNPIHDIMSLESETAQADEVKKAYAKVKSVLRSVKKRLPKRELSLKRRLKLVHRAMKQAGIRFKDKLTGHGFVEGINNGELDLYHRSYVLFAVAHELGWPVEEMDPHLWLEEVEGKQALQWVQDHNSLSLERLESDPRFEEIRQTAKDLLGGDNHIYYPTRRGEYMYNFLRDGEHARGIWRRTAAGDYWSEEPTWETVLDIDALAEEEDENWVWKGPTCLPPEFDRCLVNLSRGGKDAAVVREFDTSTKEFVKGGFHLDEAKQMVNWLDRDHILVMSDFGPGTVTAAGYPRIVKEWTRGEPIEGARILLEGEESDFTAYGIRGIRPEGSLDIFFRAVTMNFDYRFFLRHPDGTMIPVPVPKQAILQNTFYGQMLFVLSGAWKPEGADAEIPAGSLISVDAKHLLDGKDGPPPMDVLFEPKERVSIGGVSVTKDAVYVKTLDNLNGRITRFTRASEEGKASWKAHDLPIPVGSKVRVTMAKPFYSDLQFTLQNFLTPKSLYSYDHKTDTIEAKKATKEAFDTEDLVVEQHEATSSDGTRIPYFVVRKNNIPYDGSTPTLLYGYGAYGKSSLPRYSKITGKLWLERGGAYVLANIRGGGEFGPEWHKAAVKENKQKSIDDFIAVAEDLVERKITSPSRLGIQGGSAGGLLVGAAFTQRPELFNAVICQVPLLDMVRYTKMLTGHAWIGEFGDPDDPKMREALLEFSPYHNLQPDARYPEVLFLTSTTDDRMHPGQARKMAAKMEEMGHPVLFHETTEGGHGAGSDIDQMAQHNAIIYTYLYQKLFDEE